MSESKSTTGYVILLIILCAISAFFGYCIGEQQMRLKAIRAGVGEFYLPAKNENLADFRWITNSITNR